MEGGEKPGVLLVEDEGLVRELGVMVLSGEMRVVEAGDGNEALEKLADLKPEEVKIIVTDLRMPGMDGIALIKQLKADERWEGVPIVVMTGTADDLIGSGLEKYGLKVVTKPYSPRDLVRVVKEVLGKKSQIEAGLT